MKFPRILLPAAGGLLLLGCSTLSPRTPVRPAPVRIQGDYTHPGSKMVFPETVGDFQRAQITRFNPAELDVAVGYLILAPVNPVIITVYVYPAPRVVSTGFPAWAAEDARARALAAHFEVVKKEIVAHHPDANPVSDEAFTLTEGGRSHPGRLATYEFAYPFTLMKQRARSSVYLFQTGKWLIKYRITYPADSRDAVAPDIEQFMNALEWPG